MNPQSSKTYLYLVKLLSARDYSEHKLREKLQEKQHPADEVESALAELKARGFIRENAYAESRVKAFMEKGYSPDYIRQRLAEENLNLSDEGIFSVFTEHQLTPEEQIERLIRKKIRGKNEFDYNEENKILRYLLSKGHDYSNSKKILKSIIQSSVTD